MRYVLTTKIYSEQVLVTRHDTRQGVENAMGQAMTAGWNFERVTILPVDPTAETSLAMALGAITDLKGTAIGMYSIRAEIDETDILGL